MVIDTPSQIEWDRYAGLYLARSLAVGIGISLVFVVIAALVPGPAWWVLTFGGIITGIGLLYVLFWTVAEMIEDGLSDAESVA